MRAHIFFACMAAALLLLGCVGAPPAAGGSKTTSGAAATGQQNQQAGTQNPAAPPPLPEDNATASPAQQPPGKDDLLLLGRSVSQGWADYMGLEWDDNNTMSGTYQGYRIRRYEVESPPDIATSAATGMGMFDSDIVFFKLCFVDFSGDADDGLVEDEGYVQQVYAEAVTKRHRKLIVGNALPQVSADSGPGLVYNHKEYDKWLDDFAKTHKDIYVLDLNGMLTDSSGALRSDYAIAPDNSHLNSDAYARITPELMGLVARAKSA